MKNSKLAFKYLLREWRSGELYVLFFALVIAVGAVTSVNFFTDRIQQALNTQANELLGADLVLSYDREFSAEIFQKAEDYQLQYVKQITFPTMLRADSGGHLTWLKAVESQFPLRGQLGIAMELFGPEQRVNVMPESGKVWLESRLLSALDLKVGGQVFLGEKDFEVGAILTSEPGQGGVFNVAPRSLIVYDDIFATQLLQPGSRVRHSLLVSGDNARVERFRKYVEALAIPGVRIQGVEDSRPEIRVALSRAQQFLGLAALTSVVLAGVAVALAARRFTRRHLDRCAIMRCVGATQGLIFQLYSWQIFYIGLLASGIGCLLGYLVHEILVSLLSSMMDIALPSASFQPVIFGLSVGFVTLIGFALPPILALRHVPALRVLKRDLGDSSASLFVSYLVGMLALSAVMVWQANDLLLGLYMVLGVMLTVVALALCAYFSLFIIGLFQRRFTNAWGYGLRNLVRRSSSSVIQVVAFGLGLMALLVLMLIRGDLLNGWQASIPEDAPNRFLVNIHPDQVGDMREYFLKNDREVPVFFPMIKGRLVGINGEKVNPDLIESPKGKKLLLREFNLSWAKEIAKGNELIDGQWWSLGSDDVEQISIEKSVFDNLSLKLGDRLNFQVADKFFEAEVRSVREIDWGTFTANFYVLAKPGLLDDLPMTYMANFYLPADNVAFLNNLISEFSNVTVIDIAAVISHVRVIISRVTLAIQYVFFFTLLAGIMVLFAGIQSTHDERLLENGVIRTLGGRRKQILQSLSVEFASLGLLAGIVAAIFASIVAFVIAEYVLKIPAEWNFSIWFYGLLIGVFCVGGAGMAGSLGVVRQSPLQVLKKMTGN